MTENEKIIELLEKQNNYLEKISTLVLKEHREAQIGRIIHAFLIIIPAVVILVLGYYLWTSITHYLDIVNNNVNALKSNFDAMTTAFSKFIPDFSKIGSTLQQAWQNLSNWK